MNFTKEYIKECDCDEIQGLKKLPLSNWDFVCDDKFKINNVLMIYELDKWTDDLIWLPTGDQLDEEIVKCYNNNDLVNRHGYYEFYYNGLLWGAKIISSQRNFEAYEGNPLMAKIKLLKQLLAV